MSVNKTWIIRSFKGEECSEQIQLFRLTKDFSEEEAFDQGEVSVRGDGQSVGGHWVMVQLETCYTLTTCTVT